MKSVLTMLLFISFVFSAEASTDTRITFKGIADLGDDAGNQCYITLVYDAKNNIVDIQAGGSIDFSYTNRLLSLSTFLKEGQKSFRRVDHTETIGTIFSTMRTERPRDIACTGKEESCVYQTESFFQLVESRHFSREESGVHRKENFKIIMKEGHPVSAEISVMTKMSSLLEGGTQLLRLNCNGLQP